MAKFLCTMNLGRVVFALCLLFSKAHALDPTFSLEVSAINSVPLPHGTTQHIVAASGDVLTVQLYLRDWSPNGEYLRGYEAEIDQASFSSGDGGTIQPVGYMEFRSAAKDNTENAYINIKHPQYVHIHRQCIQMTDTLNAQGYRWLSLVMEEKHSPESPQDGTKFYGGTVLMEVSENARGAFTISFIENTNSSVMINNLDKPILPVLYESLTIEVKENLTRVHIDTSDPPDGAIDARSNPKNRNTIKLTFHSEIKDVHAKDFMISDHTENPPRIKRITSNDSNVTITLDRSFRVGTWTQLEYSPTGQQLSFSALPGDVNNDGERNGWDISLLEDVLNDHASLPDYQTDIDYNWRINCQDMIRLIQLLSPTSNGNIPFIIQ